MLESKDLNAWLDWITNYSDRKNMRLGRKHLLSIAERLDIINWSIPVITCTGTNGKGTCIVTMESILLASGKKVGSYISPHLYKYTERIRINGNSISEQACVKALQQIEDCLLENEKLSYFEFTTFAALLTFKSMQLDVLLLEIGIGGRLDVVNCVEPSIAVITNIGMDHCEYLGTTREQIGFEKAGIFRENIFAVCADFNPPKSVIKAAADKNCKLLLINSDFGYKIYKNNWQWWSKNTAQNNLNTLSELPFPKFPVENAALAMTVVQLLFKGQPEKKIPIETIKVGLKKAYLPGRFEIYNYKHLQIIFDVAHNPNGARWLAKKTSGLGPLKKTYAVLSVSNDKDWLGIVKPFLEIVDFWYTVNTENSLAYDAGVLAENLSTCTERPVVSYGSVDKAFSSILEAESFMGRPRVLVFGSFYTVREGLEAIGKKYNS